MYCTIKLSYWENIKCAVFALCLNSRLWEILGTRVWIVTELSAHSFLQSQSEEQSSIVRLWGLVSKHSVILRICPSGSFSIQDNNRLGNPGKFEDERCTVGNKIYLKVFHWQRWLERVSREWHNKGIIKVVWYTHYFFNQRKHQPLISILLTIYYSGRKAPSHWGFVLHLICKIDLRKVSQLHSG